MTREEFYISKRAPYGTWKCKFCGEIFESKHKLYEHLHSNHKEFNPRPKTEYFCKYCGESIGTNKQYGWKSHRLKCKVFSKILTKSGHRTLSEEEKQKISDTLKRMHAEGKILGWNKRFTLEPSYPEKWVMAMIEKEGINGNYYYNMPFHGFFLDFAWIDLKKVIEIDGKQHYEDPKQIERDMRKDSLLAEEGWQELRLSWKDIYNEPKRFIKIIKDFILDEDSEVLSEYIDVEAFQKSKILEHNLKLKSKQEKAEEKERKISERKMYFDSVDTTKWGWITQASKDLKTSRTQIRRWLKKYYPEKIKNIK